MRTRNVGARVVLVLCLTVSACATEKTLVPVSGSRADGVVKLAFEAGGLERPVVNWAQANRTAAQRCGAWGYSGAEAFGGVMEHCEQRGGFGNCIQKTVTVEYQCTGK